MKDNLLQILLTNDDGIQSPGLWAAAEALSALGYVTVAAPLNQSSGTGRSQPVTSDGHIHFQTLHVKEQDWSVYAVGGTPAQAVVHSLLELLPTRPDLVVSGINYGENIGTSVTISGTVGAALEAASWGIPAVAVSLELANVNTEYLKYSREVDFSAAAHFTQMFARLMLEHAQPADVDVLKLDIPIEATVDTPWRLTRQSRQMYFTPYVIKRESWDSTPEVGGKLTFNRDNSTPMSDIDAVKFERLVSVTPLSIELTSRVDFAALESAWHGKLGQ
jgi:5'-nucleotidase